MADIKISQLGDAIAVGDTDLVPIVSGGNTLKATVAQVKEHLIGNTNISSIGDGSVTGAISSLNSGKQPKTLDTPLTIGGVSKTTVEAALGGLVSENQTLTNVININGAKNLLPLKTTTTVENGVTFTVNSDGTISTSGTASAGITFYITDYFVPNNSSYILSGCPSGGSDATFRLSMTSNSAGTNKGNDIGNGVSFSFDKTNDINLKAYISIKNGTNMNGKVFKPMLTIAEQPDSDYAHYVPYAKTNREITSDLKGTHGSVTGLAYNKVGNIVMLHSINNGITLPQTSAIIPEDYRPKIEVRVPVATQSNTDLYWASINKDGTITLFKGGNAVTTAVNYCFLSVAYEIWD